MTLNANVMKEEPESILSLKKRLSMSTLKLKNALCDATVKAQHPEDLHGLLQYGNGLKAYIIQLLTTQMISLNRAQKL